FVSAPAASCWDAELEPHRLARSCRTAWDWQRRWCRPNGSWWPAGTARRYRKDSFSRRPDFPCRPVFPAAARSSPSCRSARQTQGKRTHSSAASEPPVADASHAPNKVDGYWFLLSSVTCRLLARHRDMLFHAGDAQEISPARLEETAKRQADRLCGQAEHVVGPARQIKLRRKRIGSAGLD